VPMHKKHEGSTGSGGDSRSDLTGLVRSRNGVCL
jgi:hypothetical protein